MVFLCRWNGYYLENNVIFITVLENFIASTIVKNMMNLKVYFQSISDELNICVLVQIVFDLIFQRKVIPTENIERRNSHISVSNKDHNKKLWISI